MTEEKKLWTTFYHESKDTTLKGQENVPNKQSAHTLDMQMEISDESEHNREERIVSFKLMESDVEMAREACYPMHENFNGLAAVQTTTDKGIFQEGVISSIKARDPHTATSDDLCQYHEWASTIQAITKKAPNGQLVDKEEN